MSNELKKDLAHVYWIGGSPCSGKSTIAEMLAARYDLRLYSIDEHYDDHFLRGVTVEFPAFALMNQLSGDALWMRPVAEQLQTELDYAADGFKFVVEDLLAMPSSKPILVEGASLPPRQTYTMLNKKRRAIWLVPTPEFQRAQYAQRPWVKRILNGCTQPAQAYENWMLRDEGLAQQVKKEARALWLRCEVVDGRKTAEELAQIVSRHFRL